MFVFCVKKSGHGAFFTCFSFIFIDKIYFQLPLFSAFIAFFMLVTFFARSLYIYFLHGKKWFYRQNYYIPVEVYHIDGSIFDLFFHMDKIYFHLNNLVRL